MNEAEWLACTDPAAMLARRGRGGPSLVERSRFAWSDRKLRLFACACCRAVWPLLTDERSRRAVEVAERFADGLATKEEMESALQDSIHATVDLFHVSASASLCCRPGPFFLPADPSVEGLPLAIQAALLREIAGNPYRTVTLSWVEQTTTLPESAAKKNLFAAAAARARALKRTVKVCPWLTWNNGVVPQLALAAYEERGRKCMKCDGSGYKRYPDFEDGTPNYSDSAPCSDCHGAGHTGDGRLDLQRLAVLADALEDADCTDENILRHLRGQERSHDAAANIVRGEPWRLLRGPHVRGCWVVDLLLGKD